MVNAWQVWMHEKEARGGREKLIFALLFLPCIDVTATPLSQPTNNACKQPMADMLDAILLSPSKNIVHSLCFQGKKIFFLSLTRGACTLSCLLPPATANNSCKQPMADMLDAILLNPSKDIVHGLCFQGKDLFS